VEENTERALRENAQKPKTMGVSLNRASNPIEQKNPRKKYEKARWVRSTPGEKTEKKKRTKRNRTVTKQAGGGGQEGGWGGGQDFLEPSCPPGGGWVGGGTRLGGGCEAPESGVKKWVRGTGMTKRPGGGSKTQNTQKEAKCKKHRSGKDRKKLKLSICVPKVMATGKLCGEAGTEGRREGLVEAKN